MSSSRRSSSSQSRAPQQSLRSAGVLSHQHLDLDFGALEEEFRQAFLLRLLRRGTIDDDHYELLRSWEHSGFSAFSERVIEAGDIPALESATPVPSAPASGKQCMERSPVSLERLTLLDTGFATYQGRFHPSLGTDHRCLTALEFLALTVPHVHHRYECRLHFYGAVSTTYRRRWGRIGKHPGPPPAPSHEPEEADEFAEFMKPESVARQSATVWGGA